MTNWYLIIFIFLCKICIFMDFIYSTLVKHNTDMYRSEYGDGYGTKWIYFPDGDGELHYINLTITEDEILIHRNSMFDDIEFRLYVGIENRQSCTWSLAPSVFNTRIRIKQDCSKTSWYDTCFFAGCRKMNRVRGRNDTESYILLNRQGKAIKKGYHSIAKNIFVNDKPIKIITHGWRSSVDKEGVVNMKNAYLEALNVNIITVDWSYTADSILYPWVANETKTIGSEVAVFLNGLTKLYNITGEKIHLIGHSLGAHVMGIAASKTNSAVYRVTGLDPARPFFEFPPQDVFAKLDSTDAEIVDVIHTCAGLLGFEAAVGTVDFYPNAGIAPQPGCEDIIKFFDACSHGRSYYYFTESIKYPTSFPAYQCQSWMDFTENRCSHNGFMGEAVSRNMSGKFYLTTNAFEPFGKRFDL